MGFGFKFKPCFVVPVGLGLLSLVQAGALGASNWQIGPCGRGGLCPGSYTPLPTPTSTLTPLANAATPTPWPSPMPTATPLPGAFQLRINVGASQAFTDSQNQVWQPDEPASAYPTSGYGYFDAGPAYAASGNVDLTADPAIYLSFRQAPLLHYEVAVPPGQYLVTLLFAEFLAQAPGQRVMEIVLQGVTQSASVDIEAAVGSSRALELANPVTVASGPLDIQVVGQVGTAVLSGLRVAGLQPGASPSPTPTATASPSPAPSPTASATPAPGQAIILQLSQPAGAVLLP